MTSDRDDLITPKAIAELLGVSLPTVYRAARVGLLGVGVQIGNGRARPHRLYLRRDVELLMRANENLRAQIEASAREIAGTE